MLKFVLCAAAAMLLPAVPASAQSAQEYAQGLQSLVGSKYEAGLVIQAVTAEQNTLVILIDGPKDFRLGSTAASLSDALLVGLCGSAPTFFDTGITLRVDTTEAHATLLKGPIVAKCPAASK